MINNIKKGGIQVIQLKKIWLCLYLFTIGTAMFVAYPLMTYLKNQVGHSLLVKDMLDGLNYTFYNDFINHYADGVAVILNQSYLVLLLYFIGWIFLHGGILKSYQTPTQVFDKGNFWKNSVVYFFKMSKITVFFLLIQAVILGVFLFIYFKVTKNMSPISIQHEGIILQAIQYLSLIYIPVVILIFLWQDYTKVIFIHHDYQKVRYAIKSSLLFLLRHLKNTLGVYLLNISFFVGLCILNYYITTSFEIRTLGTIFCSFAISQLFVISRLGLKLLNLSSIGFVYRQLTDR